MSGYRPLNDALWGGLRAPRGIPGATWQRFDGPCADRLRARTRASPHQDICVGPYERGRRRCIISYACAGVESRNLGGETMLADKPRRESARLVDEEGAEVRYARLVTDPDAGLTVVSLMTRRELLETVRERKLRSIDVAGMEWLDADTLKDMAKRCEDHQEQGMSALTLDWCRAVDDQVIGTIARSMGSGLRDLSLRGCPAVTLRGVLMVLAFCPRLRSLNLGRNPDLLTLPDVCPDDDLLELFNASLPPALREGIRIETSHLTTDKDRELTEARADFMELLGSVPKGLSHLNLSGVHGVDDAFLEGLPEGNVLEFLDLSGCPQITDRGLEAVAKRCRRLRQLELAGAVCVGDAGIGALAAAGPPLREVSISGCSKVTRAGLGALASAAGSTLAVLNIANCHGVGADCIKEVALLCPCLEEVNLSGIQNIDRICLEALTTLDSLRKVHLDGCYGVTRQALQQARESRPDISFVRRRDAAVGLANSGGLLPHWKPLPASQQLKAIAKDAKGSSSSKKDSKKKKKK